MTQQALHTNGTVMIVDDTPGNLALLSDTLSEASYRVLVATDGLSAIGQIQYLKPDIILLDVMMPGIDGFETCRRLKADPETSHIPILFMTGLSELDDLLRGLGEGGQDYIVKPIRPPEVLARIEVHLNQARALQRTQNALRHSEFSALSTDASALITWLTPSAQQWLEEFASHQGLTACNGCGAALPLPLADWVARSVAAKGAANGGYASYSLKPHFSAKLCLPPFAGEYLLLLQRNADEWDLHSMHSQWGLTLREAEILMWISRGKTNKEIGMILDCSPRTINKHLEHIFEKLGVVTRAAAVSRVLQQPNPNH